MRRRTPLLVVFLAALCSAGLAHAQSNPQQLADANRSAMEAYNNLDIETAKKQLEEAAKNAEKNSVKGPSLARTYANLGVIYVGGLSDNAAGLDAFVKALKEDATVEPDPLVSTPEIQQVFSLARRKAGVSTGSGGSPQPSPEPGPVEGNLEHVPPREQLTQTALPVFVRVGAELSVAAVQVFYRSLGMQQPKQLDLRQLGDGWGALIPCTDVFEPNVEYFIVALDDEGAQVGNAGTPKNPIAVPIVTERTQPSPSLPGEAAPNQCTGDEECPPGMPGCSGKGGLGDTCRADKDCGEGLTCSDDFCATGDKPDEEGASDPSDAPRLYIDVGFGGGFALTSSGMESDAAPPPDVALAACEAGSDGCTGMLGDGIDEQRVKSFLENRGWDCDVTPGDMGGITLSNCTVAMDKGGFVPTPVLNVAIGYYITPRFALAATGRIQIGAGEGTLAGIVAGVRGEYLLTQPAAKGLHVGLFVGAGVGRIQAQPPPKDGGAKGPYVTSGLGGVQAGVKLGYRFVRNFGLQFTGQANAMLPKFLFALDATAGVEVAF